MQVRVKLIDLLVIGEVSEACSIADLLLGYGGEFAWSEAVLKGHGARLAELRLSLRSWVELRLGRQGVRTFIDRRRGPGAVQEAILSRRLLGLHSERPTLESIEFRLGRLVTICDALTEVLVGFERRDLRLGGFRGRIGLGNWPEADLNPLIFVQLGLCRFVARVVPLCEYWIGVELGDLRDRRCT